MGCTLTGAVLGRGELFPSLPYTVPAHGTAGLSGPHRLSESPPEPPISVTATGDSQRPGPGHSAWTPAGAPLRPPVCARAPCSALRPYPRGSRSPSSGRQTNGVTQGWLERTGLIKGKADSSSCRSCTDRREKKPTNPKTPKPTNPPTQFPTQAGFRGRLLPPHSTAKAKPCAPSWHRGPGGGARCQLLHQRAAAACHTARARRAGPGRRLGEAQRGAGCHWVGASPFQALPKKQKQNKTPNTTANGSSNRSVRDSNPLRDERALPPHGQGPQLRPRTRGPVTSTAVDISIVSLIPLGPLRKDGRRLRKRTGSSRLINSKVKVHLPLSPFRLLCAAGRVSVPPPRPRSGGRPRLRPPPGPAPEPTLLSLGQSSRTLGTETVSSTQHRAGRGNRAVGAQKSSNQTTAMLNASPRPERTGGLPWARMLPAVGAAGKTSAASPAQHHRPCASSPGSRPHVLLGPRASAGPAGPPEASRCPLRTLPLAEEAGLTLSPPASHRAVRDGAPCHPLTRSTSVWRHCREQRQQPGWLGAMSTTLSAKQP